MSTLAAAPHPAARRAWLSLIVVAAIGAALYVGLPEVAGLDETWGRLSKGDPWWLIAALLFEIASYTGYVVLFRGGCSPTPSPRSAGATATTSRWRVWPPPACSRRRGSAGSR